MDKKQVEKRNQGNDWMSKDKTNQDHNKPMSDPKDPSHDWSSKDKTNQDYNKPKSDPKDPSHDWSSKDKTNQDHNKPMSDPKDPSHDKKQRIGDDDGKARKEQVLARVNDNPDVDRDVQPKKHTQTGKEQSNITRTSREDDGKDKSTGRNEGDSRNNPKRDEKSDSKRDETRNVKPDSF
jgi:hypothetical protein